MPDDPVSWKEIRKSKLREYLGFSYIISILLLGLIFVEIFFSGNINAFKYSFIMIFLFSIFGIILTKYSKDRIKVTTPSKLNYLIIILYISFITILIYNQMIFQDKHFIKVLYFERFQQPETGFNNNGSLYMGGLVDRRFH